MFESPGKNPRSPGTTVPLTNQFVLKGQITLILVANAGMALPANLILLVEREILQAVDDKALLGIKL